MTKKENQTTEENVLTSSEAQTESEEVSEQPSNVDESFLVDDVEVVFKEPTEEQLPIEPVPMKGEGSVTSDYWKEDDWQATVIGETPAGNQLQITKRENGGGYQLSLRGGGTLPALFSGWYTSYSKAEEAARLFLSIEWEEARATAASA